MKNKFANCSRFGKRDYKGQLLPLRKRLTVAQTKRRKKKIERRKQK